MLRKDRLTFKKGAIPYFLTTYNAASSRDAATLKSWKVVYRYHDMYQDSSSFVSYGVSHFESQITRCAHT
jgi:hypothetical protein